MFTTKRKIDYKRCMNVLYSCRTIGQLNTTMNMIYNYGKMYGFNRYWSKLDIVSMDLFKIHMDILDYEERLNSVQKTSDNS